MAPRVFRDRRDAGRVLACLLENYRDQDDVVVLGLPRGGVPVAYEVATALNATLDIFGVRKLGVPQRPELAMGAIASGGVVLLNDDVVRAARVHDTLRNAFVVEVGELLPRVEVLQQRRATRARAQRVVGVPDTDTLLRGERRSGRITAEFLKLFML